MTILPRRSWMALFAFAIVTPLCHSQGIQPVSATQTKEIDQALTWINEARRNYTAVRDYSGTLITKERIQGKMLEDNVIDIKFKAPFAVHMKWQGPAASRGQEVAFVAGKNNNKMRVHSNKLGGGKLLGWMSIDVNDPRVLENSRHTIVEAGIGNLIERTVKALETDKAMGKTETRISEAQFNGRGCYRIESIRREKGTQYYAYRSVIYLDKESKLPIRNENYDWPSAANPEGDLLEVFSYLNLRFNSGIADREFEK